MKKMIIFFNLLFLAHIACDTGGGGYISVEPQYGNVCTPATPPWISVKTVSRNEIELTLRPGCAIPCIHVIDIESSVDSTAIWNFIGGTSDEKYIDKNLNPNTLYAYRARTRYSSTADCPAPPYSQYSVAVTARTLN